MIDQQTLKHVLRYDPDTGIFQWNHGGMRKRQHAVAGCVSAISRYRVIGISGKLYYASRLAFLYMTGSWPKNQMDHINRIRDDDRWLNLRDATRSQNCRNRAPCGRVPYKGVYIKAGKFRAQITTRNGRKKYLGIFETAEKAAEAYRAAAFKLYPDDPFVS